MAQLASSTIYGDFAVNGSASIKGASFKITTSHGNIALANSYSGNTDPAIHLHRNDWRSGDAIQLRAAGAADSEWLAIDFWDDSANDHENLINFKRNSLDIKTDVNIDGGVNATSPDIAGNQLRRSSTGGNSGGFGFGNQDQEWQMFGNDTRAALRSGSGSNYLMYWGKNGNIGVNQSSASYNLDVNGSIGLSGNIEMGGDIHWANGEITSGDNNTNGRIIARAINNPSDGDAIFAVESSGGATRMGVTQGSGMWVRDGIRVATYDNGGMSAANGNMYANDFQTTSDKRVKSDITPIKNILDIYEHIEHVYEFEKEGSTRREVGLIAQEVEAGNPMFTGTDVHPEYDEILTLSAHHIASLAVGGVKELIQENKKLKNQIESLEKRISNLEG